MALHLMLIGCVCAAYLLWQIVSLLKDPLRSIPGPFAARLTKLWCLRRISFEQWNWEIIALHRKYNSKIVRYGPGEYSISDPDAIKTIHGHGKAFDKSDFYVSWAAPNMKGIFNQQSNELHARTRKKFAAMYSMTGVHSYEQRVVDCVQLLCERLDEQVGKTIDLAWWTLCFTSDSIGTLTYGKRFGFLDAGEDVGGLSKSVQGVAVYAMLMGQLPWLHPIVFNATSLLTKLVPWQGTAKQYLNTYTAQTVKDRRQERDLDPEISKYTDGEPTTMLDKFLDANEKDATVFTNSDIMAGLSANVIAGSETTSAAISAILFHLSKEQQAMQTLRNGIDALTGSASSAESISLKDAQSMQYLNAVIMEALRLYPQTGFGLPRAVPAGGAEISGRFFPPGSVVSVNAWAIHRDPANFGNDAEEFRPERWLTQDKEKLAEMNRCYFPFGLGSRNCIGKNLAFLMMLKAVPELVVRYDWELVGAQKYSKEMETVDYFVMRPKDIPAVVRRR